MERLQIRAFYAHKIHYMNKLNIKPMNVQRKAEIKDFLNWYLDTNKVRVVDQITKAEVLRAYDNYCSDNINEIAPYDDSDDIIIDGELCIGCRKLTDKRDNDNNPCCDTCNPRNIFNSDLDF